MCYCYRKLEILCILYVWEAEFGRPWEAVGGRGALIGLEICVRESQIFEANQSPTASHGLSRPLTASHNLSCDLSEPIREPRIGLHRALCVTWEAVCDRISHGLSRTPGDAVILGPVWLISRLNALLRPVESDRCAWEADRTPTRPLTDSHGLTDLRVRSVRPICEAVRGRARPLRQITWLCGERPWSDSHGLSDLWGRGSPRCRSASHAHRAMQSDPRGRLTDFTAKCIV